MPDQLLEILPSTASDSDRTRQMPSVTDKPCQAVRDGIFILVPDSISPAKRPDYEDFVRLMTLVGE